MRTHLIILALLATLAGYANDHRVCVYRGSIISTEQAVTADRPTRVRLRAWIILDWEQTVVDSDNGTEKLTRVAVITLDKAGVVTRLDYTDDADASLPAFIVIPQATEALGIVASARSDLGWQTLLLEGNAANLTVSDTVWSVPKRLRGRGLVYSNQDGPAASNDRYRFKLNRPLTLESAGLADAATAFEAAVANVETAAYRGH